MLTDACLSADGGQWMTPQAEVAWALLCMENNTHQGTEKLCKPHHAQWQQIWKLRAANFWGCHNRPGGNM